MSSIMWSYIAQEQETLGRLMGSEAVGAFAARAGGGLEAVRLTYVGIASTVTTLGPEFMPRLIAVVIFLLGLLNLNTAIRNFKFLKDHGQLEPYEGKKTFKQLLYDNLDWVSGVLMLVYVFSIGSLGFLLPSIVYMFLQILLYTTMGKRNYLVAILSSVLIPCAVYFLFRNYFFLMLPKGILG